MPMPEVHIKRPFPERRDAILPFAVLLWITCALLADYNASITEQRMVGGLTWTLLAVLLLGERPVVRVQVVMAVAFATLMELTGSVWLEAYTYRLENIPLYVPPGHGLIYLAAVAGARTFFVQRHLRAIGWAAVLSCAAWTTWGVVISPRPDLLSAALFLVFAGCIFVWKSPAVYALAFAITTHLELLGTALGNWSWAAQAGWLSAGNPPSAVVAGYCVIDAVALAGGAWVARHFLNSHEEPAGEEIRSQVLRPLVPFTRRGDHRGAA